MLGVSAKETQKVSNWTEKRLCKSKEENINDIDTKTLIAPKKFKL